MNQIQNEILAICYANWRETGSSYGELLIKNSNMFTRYFLNTRYLCEEGYLNAISDNIYSEHISITDMLLKFELTQKGLDYCLESEKLK